MGGRVGGDLAHRSGAARQRLTAAGRAHASGPTRWSPTFSALAKSSSMATRVRLAAARHGGRDRGAVATGAVHPHLTGGDLVDPAPQLVHGDVHRARDRRGVVLVGAPDVEDDHVAVVADLLEVGERARSGSCRARRRPSPRGDPVACAAGRSMPIRTSSRCASATSLGGLAEQGDRRAPRDEPAEVGREAAVEAEVQGARGVPAANAVRVRRSTTHSPASIRLRSSVASASSGGLRSGSPGPAALAGPMCA